MKNQTYRLWNMIILFLCLSTLSGCKRAAESKTMLLPEEEMEQGVAFQGEEGDHYTVRKMYSEDYESFVYGGFTAFLSGTGEHQVRIAESNTDGLRVQTLDYRYGFYDSELIPFGGLLDSLDLMMSWDYKDGQNLETEFFSPDGRYLLYKRGDLSYPGMRLYLMDMKTGEEELLLDGDAAECYDDQFIILAAWSRDASLLCYGFYPRTLDVWNSYDVDRLLLYYRDMKTGEIVNRLNYYYADTTEKPQDLQSTGLYVDRDEKDILTAIVSGQEDGGGNMAAAGGSEMGDEERNVSSNQVYIDLFSLTIPDQGQEKEEMVKPYAVNCPRDAKLYLDAAGETLYFTSQKDGILSFNVKDGTCVSVIPLEPALGIGDFCVLEDGEAFVTAEYDREYTDIWHQDICLYTLTEEGMTRRVLYQDAGCVIRLQYDPVYQRILAETGKADASDEINYGADAHIRWSEDRRALVLEF